VLSIKDICHFVLSFTSIDLVKSGQFSTVGTVIGKGCISLVSGSVLRYGEKNGPITK
jgi:hypothetical protein